MGNELACPVCNAKVPRGASQCLVCRSSLAGLDDSRGGPFPAQRAASAALGQSAGGYARLPLGPLGGDTIAPPRVAPQPRVAPPPDEDELATSDEVTHQRAAFESGATIRERYQLRRSFGEGVLGASWLARDGRTGADVVLKVVADMLVTNERERSDLVGKLEMFAGRTLPGVVMPREVFVVPGSVVLVYPCVDAVSLRAVIDARRAAGMRCTPEESLRVAMALTAALQAMHTASPHGALWPQNVLVTAKGLLVVDGFIAVSVAPDRLAARLEHHPRALPFAAPELLAGRRPTASADLYALGAIVAELAGGAPPGEGPDLASISRELHRSVATLLDREPGRRPGGPRALLDALTAASGFEQRPADMPLVVPESVLAIGYAHEDAAMGPGAIDPPTLPAPESAPRAMPIASTPRAAPIAPPPATPTPRAAPAAPLPPAPASLPPAPAPRVAPAAPLPPAPLPPAPAPRAAPPAPLPPAPPQPQPQSPPAAQADPAVGPPGRLRGPTATLPASSQRPNSLVASGPPPSMAVKSGPPGAKISLPPQPVAPQSATPQPIKPEPVAPQSSVPRPIAPQAPSPPSSASPPAPPQSAPAPATPRPIAPATPKPIAPATPKPVAPATPKPVAPQPVAPQPAAPQPAAPRPSRAPAPPPSIAGSLPLPSGAERGADGRIFPKTLPSINEALSAAAKAARAAMPPARPPSSSPAQSASQPPSNAPKPATLPSRIPPVSPQAPRPPAVPPRPPPPSARPPLPARAPSPPTAPARPAASASPPATERSLSDDDEIDPKLLRAARMLDDERRRER